MEQIMKKQHLNANISAVTFHGISRSCQRKIALLATILIWAMLGYSGYLAASMLDRVSGVDAVSLLATGAILLSYVLSGKFLPLVAAKFIMAYTPLGVLYRHDMKVIDQAKAECLGISQQVIFAQYLEYAKVNPAIRCKEHQLVIAHQEKGDLESWIKNVRNLKHLSNLIYQIHLVEQVLQADNP